MANHLDLEEQEQLDQLKAFWGQYGNLITWALIAVLAAFAGWNGYQRWLTSQSAQASGLYDELDRVVKARESEKVGRVFADMKDKFGGTVYAQQAGLLAAKSLYESGKVEDAKAALAWVADKSSDGAYQAVARLRLASVLVDGKAFDEALAQLGKPFPAEFAALAADRKGDIFMLQGKKTEARAEFEKAYRTFDANTEYRRLVEVKLNALGVSPQPAVAGAAGDAPK
jgi:predicted negative regulator of RcsB-dependent stress response